MSQTTYINPFTGKGWTDREEAIISKIMSEERMSVDGDLPCTRPEAIRRMHRRGLDDLKGRPDVADIATIAPVRAIESDIRYCLNQSAGAHRLPDDFRANARYCDRACQQAAYRRRTLGKAA